MKIGLFGGSFNPPHSGHTALAREFYQASGCDLLIVMPSFIPPHKAASNVPAEHRLAMTRLAFLPLGEEGVNYTVSDYEILRHDTSYTFETVRYLLEKYREKELALCVGSDMFLSFETWKNDKELLQNCHLYTKARHNGEKKALQAYAAELHERYGARSTVMDSAILDISSTQLREADQNGSFLLDPAVRAYAHEHRLYENNGENTELRKN